MARDNPLKCPTCGVQLTNQAHSRRMQKLPQILSGDSLLHTSLRNPQSRLSLDLSQNYLFLKIYINVYSEI